MSEFGFAAAVTGAFFVLGIVFGVLAVIAASALRNDGKRARRKQAKRDRAGPGDYDTSQTATRTGAGTSWTGTGADSGAGTGTGWSWRWTDAPGTRWAEPVVLDENSAGTGPARWPGGPSRR